MNLANDLQLSTKFPVAQLLYNDPTCIWKSVGLIPLEEPEFFFTFSFSLIADVSYVW